MGYGAGTEQTDKRAGYFRQWAIIFNSALYVYARIYIMYAPFFSLMVFGKLCFITYLIISMLRFYFQLFIKKSYIYLVCVIKSPTFASAFENESSVDLTF